MNLIQQQRLERSERLLLNQLSKMRNENNFTAYVKRLIQGAKNGTDKK